jgi:xylan 1,4-beta-xylosidase
MSIQVDAAKSVDQTKPIWAFFGYDEPNYATPKKGQKLLTELQQLSPVPVYIRTHNLLTSKGNSLSPEYAWINYKYFLLLITHKIFKQRGSASP